MPIKTQDIELALFAITLQQNQPLIALLGSAIPLFFWILESLQLSCYPRIAELETILRNE